MLLKIYFIQRYLKLLNIILYILIKILDMKIIYVKITEEIMIF